jgi:hypothetical protein
LINLEAKAHLAGPYDDILSHKILVGFGFRSYRYIFGLNGFCLVNLQTGRPGSVLGTGTRVTQRSF